MLVSRARGRTNTSLERDLRKTARLASEPFLNGLRTEFFAALLMGHYLLDLTQPRRAQLLNNFLGQFINQQS